MKKKDKINNNHKINHGNANINKTTRLSAKRVLAFLIIIILIFVLLVRKNWVFTNS